MNQEALGSCHIRAIGFGGARLPPPWRPPVWFATGQSWIKCSSLPHARQTYPSRGFLPPVSPTAFFTGQSRTKWPGWGVLCVSDVRSVVRAPTYLVADTADVPLVWFLPVRTLGYEMLSTNVSRLVDNKTNFDNPHRRIHKFCTCNLAEACPTAHLRNRATKVRHSAATPLKLCPPVLLRFPGCCWLPHR